jgi:ubiquinone/menaquinone biosynthesis C-methylase UbiE
MPRETIVSDFTDAAKHHHTKDLADYLEYVNNIPEIRGMKERSYRYLALREGDAVLDPGCGSGYDAIRMAGMVGREGKVLGIDLNEHLLSIARENAKGRDLPVSFEVQDISRLDLHDESFDAIRIERTLQILKDPGRVLDELVRVLKPSGRLVAVEPDWDTLVIDPGSRETEEAFFRFCNDQFPDGSTGRKLYRYFKERDLREVRVYAEPLLIHDFEPVFHLLNMKQFLPAAVKQGVIGHDALALWQHEMKSASDDGQFTFAGLFFVATGRK